jgi:hypothetical protein
MTPERRARLVALGELHDKWVDHALPDATFDPESRPAGSDYQQHYADLDAAAADQDAYQRQARKVMGLDPDTGLRTQ